MADEKPDAKTIEIKELYDKITVLTRAARKHTDNDWEGVQRKLIDHHRNLHKCYVELAHSHGRMLEIARAEMTEYFEIGKDND